MNIYRTATEIQKDIIKQKQSGKRIGFVPTMGYLHEGHLSLVRKARAENDTVCVSIFVNPTQFGPGEDFKRYPRDEERDLDLLEKENVDLVFIPTSQEIYHDSFSTYIIPPSRSHGWCGDTRPGHFQGVCTIVAVLFNITQPSRAYFGRKDAQQAAVIRQMTKDLRFPIEITVCPTVREADGLAMSSRNAYLSPEERQAALNLPKTLSEGIERYKNGEKKADVILDEGKEKVQSHPQVKLDYLGIVDQNTFQSADFIEEGNLFIGSIYVGKTRLIDNMIFEQ